MRLDFYKVHRFLIGMGIILLPVLASLGMNSSAAGLLGGMGQDAPFYPFFVGMVVWGIQVVFLKKKVYIPTDRSSHFLLLFLFAILLSGVLNIKGISAYTFGGKSSWDRYIIQSGSMILYVIGAIYFYNFFREMKGEKIRFFFRCLLASFCLTGVYSFFEITAIFNAASRDIIGAIDQIVRGGDAFHFYGVRIRSMAYEASLFGTYMSAAFPILCYYSIREKRFSKYTLLFVYGIILLLLSLSRNAYFICCIEGTVLLYIYRQEWKAYYFKRTIGILLCLGIVFWGLFSAYEDVMAKVDIGNILFSFLEQQAGGHDTSNTTRLGSMAGAFNIFLSYPLWGIGWGLGSYHLNDFYPSWAWLSSEISVGFVDAPNIFGIYPRILAELGGVGFFAWMGCWFSVLYGLIRFGMTNPKSREWQVIAVALFGVLLSGFNMDIFHFWVYWLIIGLYWASKEGVC